MIAVVAVALEDEDVTAPSAGSNAVFEELIEVTARDNEFSTEDLQAPSGRVVAIVLTNEGNSPHNLAIPAQGIGMEVIGGDQKALTTFDLPAGQYEYLSEVHPSMRGILTVE